MKRLIQGLAVVAFFVGLALGTGTRVSTQTAPPFLVFGSQSGLPVAIKATSNALWVSVVSVPFFNSSASSVLAINSNVVAPTGSVHHVGAGLIKTITVPAGCTPTCSIDIVPDAAFTTDATGNISLASTATQNRTMRFSWDGSKWNPSY